MVHYNDYAHSILKMKPFSRETPTGGNANTVNYAKYRMAPALEAKRFKGTTSANYKQVIEFGDNEDKNYLSFDAGTNGNYFGGHYFDGNQAHKDGKL